VHLAKCKIRELGVRSVYTIEGLVKLAIPKMTLLALRRRELYSKRRLNKG